jgi:hypothetical protein
LVRGFGRRRGGRVGGKNQGEGAEQASEQYGRKGLFHGNGEEGWAHASIPKKINAASE